MDAHTLQLPRFCGNCSASSNGIALGSYLYRLQNSGFGLKNNNTACSVDFDTIK